MQSAKVIFEVEYKLLSHDAAITSSLLPLSGNLPESCQPDDEDESGLRAVRSSSTSFAPAFVS
jgi:hypothetical protein